MLSKEQREHMDIIGKEMKTVLVNGLLDVLEETGTMDRAMQYAMDYFFETEKNGADTENSRQNEGNADTESSRQMKDNTEERENTKSSVRKVVVG